LVRVDAVLVSQALTNLVDNALKHAPADSDVEIVVRRRSGAIEIAVRDRGAGIGAGDANRLFERFTQGRDETADRGVGLGLAIVKAVAEAHGGGVAAANRRTGGAVFRFTVPVSDVVPRVDDEAESTEAR
jgi:two-component system sensor histidine kinase KdpD